MALDSDILREEMATQIALKNRPIVDKVTLDAIAIAIVKHITENAVTTTPVTSGSSAGSYDGTVS